jgi:hypothetical protein
MAGATDFTATNVLNYITGQLAMPALPSVWVGLFTTAPTSDSGVTGATEVSGGSYARVQVAGSTAAASASGSTITFGALPSYVTVGMAVRDITTPGNVPANTTISSIAGNVITCNNSVASVGTNTIDFSSFVPPTNSSGTEPAVTAAFAQNNAVITFPQATAGWTTVVAFGLFDAVSGGNLLAWDWLGNFKWFPFSITAANPGVISMDSVSAYANGTTVVMTGKLGGLFPTVATNFAGVLTTAGLSGGTFNVGVQATAAGEGMIRQILQQSIPINVTASFAQNTLIISNA